MIGNNRAFIHLEDRSDAVAVVACAVRRVEREASRLDVRNRLLGVIGTDERFGEAHFVAVSPKGEIYVADSVNRAVQKFVKK